MEFLISKEELLSDKIKLVVEDSAFPGVKRIAGYVSKDIEKVFGKDVSVVPSFDGKKIVAATIGKSNIVSELEKAAKVDTSVINGKNECYIFTVVDGDLYIIGSDKRGTVYGLFYLSELLGVSPFVNWADVMPIKKDSVLLKDDVFKVSKEPSVCYRGFFINDEWPACGNWSEKNFGGFNAKMYEKVFELLLRLKGNYLWPAMWSAQFNLDGPGIENARLADEMGVVMGMSHHEPCNRNGEEYKYVRGKDSIYGDDWNFVRNRQGITKFWEDGLLRNAPYENVITVGMRGEADSTILGHEATLKDNIDYLKDVLTTQEQLIKKCVNEDISKVPRMLALYKEVEPFYYGDENTEGLMHCKELEGVTLMLCDDNYGNLRTVPTEEMKGHNGGFGMYYHFDYHGFPISFEWINSSYLPKVWEQMCTAYDNEIKKLWIVNVGDIFTTEFPLSYFLDLAYDYEKWGSSNVNSAVEYTDKFIDRLFPGFSNEEKEKTVELIKGYTHIAHNRRPEAMNVNVYNAWDEGPKLYSRCLELMDKCEKMYESCAEEYKFPFFEFIYYPLMGNLNVQVMWLENTFNDYLCKIGAICANEYNAKVKERIAFDKKLVSRLHEAHDGMWYGMGLSEHIGFKNWNEEENAYPILKEMIPTNKNRFVVTVLNEAAASEGGDWTKKTLVIKDFIKSNSKQATIRLYATNYSDSEYEIENVSPFLMANPTMGTVPGGSYTDIMVSVDSSYKTPSVGEITVKGQFGRTLIKVPVNMNPDEVTLLAKDYVSLTPSEKGYMTVIPEYGRDFSGIKALPMDQTFVPGVDAPYAEYEFNVCCEGKYVAEVMVSASNPPYTDMKSYYGISVNGGEVRTVNSVADGFRVGDGQPDWMKGVLLNYRLSTNEFMLKEGKNTLRLYAGSISLVFEQIKIYKAD